MDYAHTKLSPFGRRNSNYSNGNAFANGRLSCDIEMNITRERTCWLAVGFAGRKELAMRDVTF